MLRRVIPDQTVWEERTMVVGGNGNLFSKINYKLGIGNFTCFFFVIVNYLGNLFLRTIYEISFFFVFETYLGN